MHLHAVGGMQDDAPVSEFVAKAFDHESAVGGNVPGGLLLLFDEGDQVGDGPIVQPAGRDPLPDVRGRARCNFARECTDRAPQFGRPAKAVALPKWNAARLAEGRGDDHAVVGDVLDLPARRTESEDVTHPGLVDHLLIEFADAAASSRLRRIGADHEHSEQPAVGDRSAGGHGQPLRTGAPGDGAVHPVPDDPRAQLGKFVRGVAATEQIECCLIC